jgi:hypothetical protein
MKRLWIILLFGCLFIPALSAQTLQIKYEPRKIDFPDPANVVFKPYKNITTGIFNIYTFPCGRGESPSVFKTPVCYSAFFCKMEVETQKAFGIMLKVHAGDYDSYMDQKIPK